MQIIPRKTLLILGLLLLAGGCSPHSEQGITGEKIFMQAQVPEEGNDLEFSWKFTGIPEGSGLSQPDLVVSDDGKDASFIPDVEGHYTVEVSVYQYNDEISTQSFEFTVQPSPETETESEESEEESGELAVTETTSETPAAEWYEEAEAEKALEELTASVAAENTEPVVEPTAAPVREEPVKAVKKKVKPKKAKPRPGSSIPYDKSRYTIQVAAKRSLDLAKSVAADLIKAGFDAYIQKAYFKETDEVWYRVRVGSYEKKETALAVARSLSQINHEQAWVDFVRYEE